MLGKVLGGGLLGQAGAVQELPLQQGQVGLQGRSGGAWTRCSQGSGREAGGQPRCLTLGKLHDLSGPGVPPLQPGNVDRTVLPGYTDSGCGETPSPGPGPPGWDFPPHQTPSHSGIWRRRGEVGSKWGCLGMAPAGPCPPSSGLEIRPHALAGQHPSVVMCHLPRSLCPSVDGSGDLAARWGVRGWHVGVGHRTAWEYVC